MPQPCTPSYELPAALAGPLSDYVEGSQDIDARPADLELEAILHRLPLLSGQERAAARGEVICGYLPLARRLARRFRGRGEDQEDLEQVAIVGLIKAVDAFDPTREVRFIHYVIPSIVGEVKRHFRDKAWSIRVPRRIQEIHLHILRATPVLSQELGRAPTTTDLARHLHVPEDDVRAGLLGALAYTTRSLNSPVRLDDSDIELLDLIGDVDERLEAVPDRHVLRDSVAELPERSRRIVTMRFVGNLTQTQIAAQIGISQMHVSRLLHQALVELRSRLLCEQ
jgi:RNA polymerase sigma-B factor